MCEKHNGGDETPVGHDDEVECDCGWSGLTEE